MQPIATPEKRAKRRGRPPITKHYANPLQSPMAQSSIQVQKQGLTGQNTSKPLMKVGVMTPSPQKRKRSESISSSSSLSLSQDGNTSTNASMESKAKKTNYRGVILLTPQRQGISTPTRAKSAGNPSDSALSTPNSVYTNVFSSTSRVNTLRSSPPTASPLLYNHKKTKTNSFAPKLQNDSFQLSNVDSIHDKNILGSANHGASTFSLSFNINSDGRASIQGSIKSLSIPTSNMDSKDKNSATLEKPIRSSNDSNSTEGDYPVNKEHVLSLLKTLRNNKALSNNSNTSTRTTENTEDVTKEEVKLPVILETSSSKPSSPKVSKQSSSKLLDSNNTLALPSTPKTHFQFTTGFTPIGIDQILLDETILDTPRRILSSFDHKLSTTINNITGLISPKAKFSNKQPGTLQTNQELVFKLTSGDPLLLTDESANGSSNTTSHNNNEVQSHLMLASPKKKRHFNTPPSWINFGSPKTSDNIRANATLLSTDAAQTHPSEHKTINMLDPSNATKIITSPMFNVSSSPRIDLSSLSQQFDFSFNNDNDNKGSILLTATPKHVADGCDDQELQLQKVIECTPLIQQTMNGSLNSKLLGTLNIEDIQSDSIDVQQKTIVPITAIAVEQDDARNALRKLMSDR